MGAAVPGAFRGHTEAARKVWPHSESGGPTSPHPPTKPIALPSFGPFSAGGFGTGAFGRSFLGAAVPRASRGHTKAARKVWPHSESGGPTLPHPPTEAIVNPSFGPFSAGVVDGGLRAVSFGRGCARGIQRAHGGRSQSLAPFRVRRTNFAPPPHQGYSTPPVLALFRWAVLGRGSWGARFWARLCPGHPVCTRRPLTKFGPIPSPAGPGPRSRQPD